MEYKVIYSKRKTLSLVVKDGEVTVRAPRGIPQKYIEAFVEKHESWICEKLALCEKRREREAGLSDNAVEDLKREARLYFKAELDRYSEIMGLKYSRMRITSAKKRFGSCNTNGVICFSYRLMLYPVAAREYVVVHELAHLKHMNHSPEFYRLIERYMPDYKERKRLLK